MFCTNCGNEVTSNAVVCVKCGVPPRAEKKFCYGCGVAINENQVVCVKCGIDLSASKRTMSTSTSASASVGSQARIRVTAALLALFIGELGIHKFYCGSKGWGIVFLVSFILGIPLCFLFIGIPVIVGLVICGFVDAIRLLVMSDEKFNERYNETPSSFKW